MMRNLVNNSIGRNIFVNLLIMFLNYFIPQLLFIFVKRFTPYYIWQEFTFTSPFAKSVVSIATSIPRPVWKWKNRISKL